MGLDNVKRNSKYKNNHVSEMAISFHIHCCNEKIYGMRLIQNIFSLHNSDTEVQPL